MILTCIFIVLIILVWLGPWVPKPQDIRMKEYLKNLEDKIDRIKK